VQRRRPYPDGAHGAVANVHLDLLDADVAGLVSQLVQHGALTDVQWSILEGCLADADRVLPELDGEVRDYFDQVRTLAAAACRTRHDPDV